MIEIDTYISILFSIIIPIIGISITIIIEKLSYFKKRDLFFILFFLSFILIIIATLIYCYDRYLYIPDMLPLNKPQFSDPLFCAKYKKYFILSFTITLSCCLLIAMDCGNIKDNGNGIVIFDTKYVIITLFLYLFISTYIHLWFIYGLCYLSFSPITCAVISFILMFIEMGILHYINTYLTFRKLAKNKNKY